MEKKKQLRSEHRYRCPICSIHTTDGFRELVEFKSLDKLDEPQMIIVWRQRQKSHYRHLTKPESYLFKHISEQTHFEALCNFMLDFFPEKQAMQWIAQTLQYWIQQEIKPIIPCV